MIGLFASAGRPGCTGAEGGDGVKPGEGRVGGAGVKPPSPGFLCGEGGGTRPGKGGLGGGGSKPEAERAGL
jgi:hypothetical protein